MAVNGKRESLRYENLILAIILAALATPIVKWLVMHGGKLGLSNINAISFCNILFVGNLCSGLVVLVYFGWKDIWRQLRELTAKTGLLLMGNLLIGTVLAPIFLYIALETTMVTNLVLLTRIEFVGGICLILGFATRIFSVPLAFIMLVAILTAQLKTVHTLAIFYFYPKCCC